MVNKDCSECGVKNSKKDKARQIYLCDGCGTTDKYKLLCKTDIKNDYQITEEELEGYDDYTVKRGRGYPNCTTFVSLTRCSLTFTVC